MNKAKVQDWVSKYVKVWRSPDVSLLAEIFVPGVIYRVSPWRRPIAGISELEKFWQKARSGPDEDFEIEHEVVAIDGPIAIIRVEVTYANDKPAHWRDLWIITFDNTGLCLKFEEWPFALGQEDGQEVLDI